MKKEANQNVKRFGIKIGIVAFISILLLIPLSMVRGLIYERQATKDEVTEEIARSVAGSQSVGGPKLYFDVVKKEGTDSTKVQTEEFSLWSYKLDYKADIKTEVLHRSIYDVIVYNSTIDISGYFLATKKLLSASRSRLEVKVQDMKGLTTTPQIELYGKKHEFHASRGYLQTDMELPKNLKEGDSIHFRMTMNLKGTEQLMFHPYSHETSLTITSSYLHPSFQGEFLPETREVSDKGFKATWKVLDININDILRDTIGVRFIDPANPYQQATRSAKYGLLIIVLVFVAGLFVEYLTKKNITFIQYAIIGLSLVLFYSLLLSFSEFMVFGLAYSIAAVMTVLALMLYFRGVFKSRNAYILGGYVALVYIVNYLLLQMETYALLTGSLVLFVLLSAVMYLTTNLNEVDSK